MTEEQVELNLVDIIEKLHRKVARIKKERDKLETAWNESQRHNRLLAQRIKELETIIRER